MENSSWGLLIGMPSAGGMGIGIDVSSLFLLELN
jgi:lysyl-tRNA synthetase class II